MTYIESFSAEVNKEMNMGGMGVWAVWAVLVMMSGGYLLWMGSTPSLPDGPLGGIITIGIGFLALTISVGFGELLATAEEIRRELHKINFREEERARRHYE